jgi:hypothetical protein
MMNRFRIALALILVVTPAAALTASGATASQLAGTWRRLPAAPIAPDFDSRTSVWTGTEMLVFGRDQRTALDARGNPYSVGSVNVAAAYNPTAKTWRRLAPPAGPKYYPGRVSAVWTGKEMLVTNLAFNPVTNKWRPLRRSLAGGIILWTGREAIGWGGGCCGDASSTGTAYNPATNAWRDLARSPLAGSQQPVGAWTGHELILFVSGFGPDGKPWPARLARAAAYNPATDTWRRIAPLPQSGPRWGGTAVWDGHEVLVVGAGTDSRSSLAYDPATNHWRRLASTESPRIGASAVWTGKQLVLWGGGTGAGLAYDPKLNRWSSLPQAPLPAKLEPTAVWTGRSVIVWGGVSTHTWGKYLAAGAAFTPTR